MPNKYTTCPHCEKRIYYKETKFAEAGAKGGRAKGKCKARGGAEHYAKMAKARWAKVKAEE